MKEKAQERILALYSSLQQGEVLCKRTEAANYQINERTIQRDLDAIRNHLLENPDGSGAELVYIRKDQGYKLEYRQNSGLQMKEILAICEMVLHCRPFVRNEAEKILDGLCQLCQNPEDRRLLEALILNEKHHYIEPQHRKPLVDRVWELGTAIRQQLVIEVEYQKVDGEFVTRRLKPVGVMFSEFYFYLTAFMEDDQKQYFDNPEDTFPTIYRVDRIRKIVVTNEHFPIPYVGRFEEGEFRKRVQFMTGGRLQRITFEYRGRSLESVLDRLPTARVLKKKQDCYLVQAEVFGDGIKAWLLSQGNCITIVAPEDLQMN